MERIQTALAKARAARAALRPLTGAAAAINRRRVAAPAARASEAAWAALPAWAADPAALASHRIVTLSGHDRAGTGFDLMRTRVLQQARAHGWRRIAITSPTPGCGKSTVALNLAFSLARQTEFRTLLMELDMRRPSMAGMLGIGGRRSMAAVLSGEADFADCALRHGSGLAIATNDRPFGNPAELLHSAGVGPVLERLAEEYAPDLMIFDMPPLLVSDDTMAFMRHVDAALLIAAAETTTIKDIDRCERELASQTNVMGVVLNKCRHMGQDGYGYGYY